MIYLGKLVNTHGIKGEVKIISNFKYKNEVFKKNNCIYISGEKLKINTYRKHKNFDMITLENYNNINEVLKFKGKDIYINEEEYTFTGPLNEKLYGLKVYGDGKEIGVLENIEDLGFEELLVIKNKNKKYLVPYVKEFVNKITEEGIYLNLIKGLINEDWYTNHISWNVYRL